MGRGKKLGQVEAYGVVVTLALAQLGNVLSALWAPKYAWTGALVSTVVVLVLLVFGKMRIPRWRKDGGLSLLPWKEHSALAAKDLVAMVSPGNGRETALAAALHHGPLGLERVWLLCSEDSAADAGWVKAEVLKRLPAVDVRVRTALRTAFNIEDVKAEVECVRKLALKGGRQQEDLVCDFTGMTKHASVGMVLACLPWVARLEYVAPLTTDERKRGVTPKPPVEVKIGYRLLDDEED
jgi:hypothetical protein